MQREIAEVMVSCALRGFRYIAFPPIVFAAPKPMPAPEAPPVQLAPPEAMASDAALPEAISASLPPEAAPPPPAELSPAPQGPVMPAASSGPAPVAPLPPPDAATRAPAMRRLTEFATSPEPAPPPARLRRLAELTDADSLHPPGDATAPRRFALLNDIAVELRPRRVRARTNARS